VIASPPLPEAYELFQPKPCLLDRSTLRSTPTRSALPAPWVLLREMPQRQPGPAVVGARHPRRPSPHGDERRETVALSRRRSHLRKTHGAGNADLVGVEPEGAPIEQQGFGWKSSMPPARRRRDHSGLEVTWTDKPTRWSNRFLEILFGYEWELSESPAGAKQWVAKDAEAIIRTRTVGRPKKPTMLTSDLHSASTRRTRRSRAGSWRTRTRVRAGVRQRPGTSCCTATWVRSRATSAPGSRRPTVAGPVPAATGTPDRRRRCGRSQGDDPRLGSLGHRPGRHRVGIGLDVPATPTSAAGERARIRLAPQKDGRSTPGPGR